MKNNWLILFILFSLFLALIGCKEKDFQNTKLQDEQELSVLKNEIETIANQFSCENNSEWKFVSIGAKACGGPIGYIAYASKIDEKSFLKKVNLYTAKQQIFNVRWGIVSDCSISATPKSVECVKGKPTFVY